MTRVVYDMTTAEGVAACEANLNEVAPSLEIVEQTLGLPWGLVIGRRRNLIRCRREGRCPGCDRIPEDRTGPQPWKCRCGSKVWQVAADHLRAAIKAATGET